MRRRARRRTAITAGATLAILLVAWSVRAADESVAIADLAFSPGTVTIAEGDSVTWTNQDQVPHTATGSDFDTGQLGAGATSTIAFPAAGTFAYACAIHPQMTGQVVVEAAAAPSDAGDGGGAALTPAPTDTQPIDRVGSPDASTVLAVLLALLGASMLAGTWWFGRRGRASREYATGRVSAPAVDSGVGGQDRHE